MHRKSVHHIRPAPLAVSQFATAALVGSDGFGDGRPHGKRLALGARFGHATQARCVRAGAHINLPTPAAQSSQMTRSEPSPKLDAIYLFIRKRF